MNHFINIKDIPSKDLKKIILDAKIRKTKRKNFNTLDSDKDSPLKGKLLIEISLMLIKCFIVIKIFYKLF